MGIAFAYEASRIRSVVGLSDQQIARATGAAPSTVRDWLSHRSSPTGRRAERVAELGEVIDRLTRVMDPDYIVVWLAKPIEALGDERPLDLVAQGEVRRVLSAISEIESPGAV
jgi:transcriptional regulator with XRE-family HTH domain